MDLQPVPTSTNGIAYDHLAMVTKPEDLDALLAGHSPTIRATTERLRQLVREMAPQANETVDLPDHLLAYGWTDRMRDLVFAIAPHTAHVNLQLADGATLPDPGAFVEGTGKRIRHVKCRSVADAERAEIRTLIEAQIQARSAPAGNR
jgi:hypothetical protein